MCAEEFLRVRWMCVCVWTWRAHFNSSLNCGRPREGVVVVNVSFLWGRDPFVHRRRRVAPFLSRILVYLAWGCASPKVCWCVATRQIRDLGITVNSLSSGF